MGFTSMIVANFDSAGCSVTPDKADSPLVINPYTPLPFAVTGKFFKSVLRWNAKIIDPVSVVKHTQLTPRHCLNLAWETTRKIPIPNLLSFAIMERCNHIDILTQNGSIVNRYLKIAANHSASRSLCSAPSVRPHYVEQNWME